MVSHGGVDDMSLECLIKRLMAERKQEGPMSGDVDLAIRCELIEEDGVEILTIYPPDMGKQPVRLEDPTGDEFAEAIFDVLRDLGMSDEDISYCEIGHRTVTDN
jgi:hypothetical protein